MKVLDGKTNSDVTALVQEKKRLANESKNLRRTSMWTIIDEISSTGCSLFSIRNMKK